MKLSLNWLRDFVDIPKHISPEQLGLDLSQKVVEVKEVKDLAADLNKIVVGKVVSASKHPNADKLMLCRVTVGRGSVPIVCGGSNVREGMLVAVALVGAKVRWHGQGDLVELQKTKIRGEVSEGMICGSDEIGLEELFPKTQENEIVDLSSLPGLQVGDLLAKALGLSDVVIEIDNSSLNHRPDLWGQFGMAREIAAMYGLRLKEPTYKKISGKGKSSMSVQVKDKKSCRAYVGVRMDGIVIGPSPSWMQKRLLALGQRPINNIVDITNYVMFELGQPTHAFDITKIEGGIVVRRAQSLEKIVTLDLVERSLTNEMFVIADKKKALVIGGVMGGQESAVTETTQAIWFESANFDPIIVRKTSKALGLRTEGSVRWEKNQDPENGLSGLQRLVQLTQEIIPTAKITGGMFSEQYWYPKVKPMTLPLSFIEQKIGSKLQKPQIVKTLKSLGFGVKGHKVFVPSWRATKDISIKEDLVEEIARLYGYNNIKTVLPRFPIRPPQANPLRDVQKTMQQVLAFECGYSEVYTYSFESPEWLKKLGEDVSAYIELENPLAKDRPLVRRHMIPGLLETVKTNLHRFNTVKLFEIGRVFHKETPGDFADNKKKDRLPAQGTELGITYAAKGDEVPFFTVSAAIASMFTRLHLEYRLNNTGNVSRDMLHPGRFAEVFVGNTAVGYVAELNPFMQEKLGIPYRVGMVQIRLDDLTRHLKDTSRYEPLPLYPSVERDMAIVVEKKIEHDTVVAAVQKASPLLASLSLFDVFIDTKLGANKKSMAYRLVYRSAERTLSTDEVDTEHRKIISLLQKTVGAEIRS